MDESCCLVPVEAFLEDGLKVVAPERCRNCESVFDCHLWMDGVCCSHSLGDRLSFVRVTEVIIEMRVTVKQTIIYY
jgi:hypothetical protein